MRVAGVFLILASMVLFAVTWGTREDVVTVRDILQMLAGVISFGVGCTLLVWGWRQSQKLTGFAAAIDSFAKNNLITGENKTVNTCEAGLLRKKSRTPRLCCLPWEEQP